MDNNYTVDGRKIPPMNDFANGGIQGIMTLFEFLTLKGYAYRTKVTLTIPKDSSIKIISR